MRLFLIGLAALLFSLRTFSMKMVAYQISPQQACMLQNLFAMVILSPFLLKTVRAPQQNRFLLQVVRALAEGGMTFLIYVMVRPLHTVHITLMSNWFPLFLPFVMLLLFRTKIDRRLLWLLLGGWVGIVVTLLPPTEGPEGIKLLGLGVGILTSVIFLTHQKLCTNYHPRVILTWNHLLQFLLFLPLAWLHWQNPTWLQWLFLIAIGACNIAIFLLITAANQQGYCYAVHPFFYLAVIFSAIIDWFIWHYIPTIYFQVGTIIVVIALWGVLQIKRRSSPSVR